MSEQTAILVATNDVNDATLVRDMLAQVYPNTSITVVPDDAAADFERTKPAVLVLAFKDIEDSERFYQGLYRAGTSVQSMPHSALVLCRKEAVEKAYQLCCAGRFDDYVLFWPLTYDSKRLFMAVERELRDLAVQASQPIASRVAARAAQIAEVGPILETALADGQTLALGLGTLLGQAETAIREAIDRFSEGLLKDGLGGVVEVRNADELHGAVRALKADGVTQGLRPVGDAIAPIGEWVADLRAQLAPHLESARAVAALVQKVRPLVLMIDDEEFLCRLMGRILEKEGMEFEYATSGDHALAVMHQRRPDLVLMDVHMPGGSGVELTRLLKDTKRFSQIPIVMLSGQSERDVVMESVRAGAADFVVKPFDKQIVLEKIRRYIGGNGTEAPA